MGECRRDYAAQGAKLFLRHRLNHLR